MKEVLMIGFQEDECEVCPGIYKPFYKEYRYVGDILSNIRKNQTADKQNTDLTTQNQISILSDLQARKNWQNIRYVVWNDVKWSVSSVRIEYPQLILELGGVFNERTC